jgi:tRNA threonylcarbamoyladenosine biosynthesis protein TsaE
MPTVATTSITILLATSSETHSLGQRLGAAASAGQILALSGDLGAGKTTLTQGIAVGLGISARVTSPTFTLVNEYDAGARLLRLIHIDTYRLADSMNTALAEAATLGLDEILATASLPDGESDGAVVVIEWAERVADLLPTDTLYITLIADPVDANARTAALTATGRESSALLAVLQSTGV